MSKQMIMLVVKARHELVTTTMPMFIDAFNLKLTVSYCDRDSKENLVIFGTSRLVPTVWFYDCLSLARAVFYCLCDYQVHHWIYTILCTAVLVCRRL